MKNYIPKHKGDIEAVNRLFNLEFNDYKDDLDELFEWLQDFHWEVSRMILEVLKRDIEKIELQILNVLKSKDSEWKYNIIVGFYFKTDLSINNQIKISDKIIKQLKEVLNANEISDRETGMFRFIDELI